MDFTNIPQTITSLWKLLILFAATGFCGLTLSLTYHLANKEKKECSQPFGWTIFIFPSLVAFLLFLVEDNFMRAVFLLGATSIIRFRNPVKYPLDTILVFAAVGVGAAAGFRFYKEAIILSILCYFIIWFNNRFVSREKKYVNRVICLDCGTDQNPDAVFENLGALVSKWKKLRIETSESADHTYWYYQVKLEMPLDSGLLLDRIQRTGLVPAF